MIKTFRDRSTEELFTTGKTRRLPTDIHKSGARALQTLHLATVLSDLRGEGRRLEAVADGRHTIRVNDRYRVRFVWREGHAYDVEILDPHRPNG